MKYSKLKNFFKVSFPLLLIFILGWCGSHLYDELKNERIINGLYLYSGDNIKEAREIALGYDYKGDWVCINVAYDMTPKEAYTTCVHECSHKAFSEIYAEKCEKEPLKCLEVLYEK